MGDVLTHIPQMHIYVYTLLLNSVTSTRVHMHPHVYSHGNTCVHTGAHLHPSCSSVAEGRAVRPRVPLSGQQGRAFSHGRYGSPALLS